MKCKTLFSKLILVISYIIQLFYPLIITMKTKQLWLFWKLSQNTDFFIIYNLKHLKKGMNKQVLGCVASPPLLGNYDRRPTNWPSNQQTVMTVHREDTLPPIWQRPEVGIYKRKKENKEDKKSSTKKAIKKTIKRPRKKEKTFFFSWSLYCFH